MRGAGRYSGMLKSDGRRHAERPVSRAGGPGHRGHRREAAARRTGGGARRTHRQRARRSELEPRPRPSSPRPRARRSCPSRGRSDEEEFGLRPAQRAAPNTDAIDTRDYGSVGAVQERSSRSTADWIATTSSPTARGPIAFVTCRSAWTPRCLIAKRLLTTSTCPAHVFNRPCSRRKWGGARAARQPLPHQQHRRHRRSCSNRPRTYGSHKSREDSAQTLGFWGAGRRARFLGPAVFMEPLDRP